MKIFDFLAIFLSAGQIVVIIYFFLKYPTDNLPFFTFLIIVPAVNIIALLAGTKK